MTDLTFEQFITSMYHCIKGATSVKGAVACYFMGHGMLYALLEQNFIGPNELKTELDGLKEKLAAHLQTLKDQGSEQGSEDIQRILTDLDD